MPQKVKNKITSQLHACLHVSLLSPINPLCSTTPLLPPPLFSAPFSSAALLSSSCHRNRYRCCCPRCTRSPRCCCCVLCLCLHQLMVLLGYEQPWCVTLICAPAASGASRSSPAATKHLFKPILRQPRRIKNKRYRTHPAGQKTIFMRGDIEKIRTQKLHSLYNVCCLTLQFPNV